MAAIQTEALHTILVNDFDTNHAAQAQLCISIDEFKLHIAVLNNSNKQFEYLSTHSLVKQEEANYLSSNLERILSNDELLSLAFEQVHIGVRPDVQVLVPNSLFDDQALSSYIALSNHDIQDVAYYHRDVKGVEAQWVFTLERGLEELFNNHFTQYSLTANAAAAFPAVLKHSKGHIGKSIVVNVLLEKIEVFAFEYGQFKLFNSYSYEHQEDFLYYVSLVANEFQMDPDQLRCTLYGNIEEHSLLANLLKRYFADVQFMPQSPQVQCSKGFESIQAFQFFNLTQLAQ